MALSYIQESESLQCQGLPPRYTSSWWHSVETPFSRTPIGSMVTRSLLLMPSVFKFGIWSLDREMYLIWLNWSRNTWSRGYMTSYILCTDSRWLYAMSKVYNCSDNCPREGTEIKLLYDIDNTFNLENAILKLKTEPVILFPSRLSISNESWRSCNGGIFWSPQCCIWSAFRLGSPWNASEWMSIKGCCRNKIL